MKTTKNLLIVILIAFAPITQAFANACLQKKNFLINEINAAIRTYPNSCRDRVVHIKCDILFRSRLPQLIGIIQRDEFANYRQVVAGVNSNAAELRSIVADAYTRQMNSLIGDLNAYNNQCVR